MNSGYLVVLNKRLETERQALERARLPKYIHLNQERFFNAKKREMVYYRRISAIELAIEVLQKSIREIDAHLAVLNCIPVTCTEFRNELEEKAHFIYLNERKEVLAEIFQRSLPILKKQMLEYLK